MGCYNKKHHDGDEDATRSNFTISNPAHLFLPNPYSISKETERGYRLLAVTGRLRRKRVVSVATGGQFQMSTNTLLFLCTGNYYRSRFAEHLFNELARREGLPWRADSCGLALERGSHNVGPISQAAARALLRHGVHVDGHERMPRTATDADFKAARRVIALDGSEHRPLMSERFPAWTDDVEYWLIHDLDRTDAASALSQIEAAVRGLVEELGTNG